MEGFYTVSEISNLVGVSSDTIRRWDKKGFIRARRLPQNNYRVFDLEEIKRVQLKVMMGNRSEPIKIKPRKLTKFTCIELFTGAGGLALGLEMAGLKSIMHVEVDRDCVKTLRDNRPKWKIIHDDIHNISFKNYNVDVVAGGFPCQAFSYAGKKLGFEDTRGTLFFEFARCVKELKKKPKIIMAENVRGLLNHENGRTLETIIDVLKSFGYIVHEPKIMKAVYYDVPQKRERLIIIATLPGINFEFPKERDYILTLKDVLKNVPKSDGLKYSKKKYEIMKLVPPGGYWRDLPLQLQKEYMGSSFFLGGGKTGMARRMSWDEPSLTLTCNPAQKQTERCHPEETRPFTVREYARVQTFPDSWGFSGSVYSQYKQIGNAVPVHLGWHLGNSIVKALENS